MRTRLTALILMCSAIIGTLALMAIPTMLETARVPTTDPVPPPQVLLATVLTPPILFCPDYTANWADCMNCSTQNFGACLNSCSTEACRTTCRNIAVQEGVRCAEKPHQSS